MTTIDKGTHFGTKVAFTVSKLADGKYHGDIRSIDANDHFANKLDNYSPMDGTYVKAETEADVIASLEAQLAEMIADAQ